MIKTLRFFAALTLCFCLFSASDNNDVKYKCIPCGLECDNKIYNKPGKCRSCRMTLVDETTIIQKSAEPSSVCFFLDSHPDAIILDVRTAAEFNGDVTTDFGTIRNAINIPLQELEKRISELEEYKNREILVYCSHSHRSPQASYLLSQKGFPLVTNLSGGISEVTDPACKISRPVKTGPGQN